MTFIRALSLLARWLLFAGLLVWWGAPKLPTEELRLVTDWSYRFFAGLSFLFMLAVGAIGRMAPQRLTMGIFALVSVRFLATATFFLIYYRTVRPESKLIVLPFGLMFVLFMILENVYALKYADYAEKRYLETTRAPVDETD